MYIGGCYTRYFQQKCALPILDFFCQLSWLRAGSGRPRGQKSSPGTWAGPRVSWARPWHHYLEHSLFLAWTGRQDLGRTELLAELTLVCQLEVVQVCICKVCIPRTTFMKSYHCFVVATTIIETQKSGNHSHRSVNSKLNGPIDEGWLQRLALRLLTL